MTDINIPNLRLFVGALREVVETVPEAAAVDMQSIKAPVCGTPGCHAGLAMLAMDRLGVPKPINGADYYRFPDQEDRLSEYLVPGMPAVRGYSSGIQRWADEHPEVWGNKCGNMMFAVGVAFDQDTEKFPSRVIADWWADVLDRLEAKP